MLLRPTSEPAMMLGTMTERSEPPARALHEPTVHLTFAEAAERLGITANAVRMRVHRGSLTSVRVNERRFVIWPQPARVQSPHDARTRAARADERSSVQSDDRLVAALEGRIESLERQLAERTEEIRRRDHIIAGFLERLPELPAGESSRQSAPQDANPGPLSDDQTAQAPDSLLDRLRRLFGR